MVEQFVLQEIMELNVEMSSMNISLEDTKVINHNLDIENQCIVKKITENEEVDENVKSKPRRSLRKRVRPLDPTPVHCYESIKIPKMNSNIADIEKYYLSKKVKRLPSTLETIFEEPKNQKQIVSTRKFKRTICFNEDLATAHRLKLRKRQLKAKKLPASKSFLNRKKVSMDSFLQKLSDMESDKE